MSRRLCGLLAGAALMLVSLAPAAHATPVTVRVVGDVAALETTQVDTTGAGVGTCAGHTAAEAIDKAVMGEWDRQAFTQTILGELHDYTVDNDYWNFWLNDEYAQEGVCTYAVKPGDRILLLVQRDDPPGTPTIFPLTLAGVPASVVTGSAFTVTVNEQRSNGMTTTPTPIAGARISDGSQILATTDAAGHATITLSAVGSKTLFAVHAGNVESEAAAVSVVAATSGPGTSTTPMTTPPPGPLTPGPDRSAPSLAIVGIAEGQRFARAAGPRRLRVEVAPDPSGLYAVKLRLTRNDRGRCTYFSGRFERFRLNHKARCSASAGSWFGVGDHSSVDYLLPGRLPRGRYVLDVNAIDKAFNRDDGRRRGGNRIVFHVG
jgi:hypothetical protein